MSLKRSLKDNKSKTKNYLDVQDIFLPVHNPQKLPCPQYRLLMRHLKEEKLVRKSLVLEICSKFVFIVSKDYLEV